MDNINELIVSLVRAAGANGAGRAKFELEPKLRHVPRATLTRKIAQLLAAETIFREGQGRATRYTLDPADLYLETPLEKRKSVALSVAFDFDRIGSYVPNKNRMLSEETLKALHKQGQILGENIAAKDLAERIYAKLLTEMSWASSKLEGNTYSMIDTEILFERGDEAPGKTKVETMMLLNHRRAISYLLDHISEIEVNKREILAIHSLLSDGLLRDPSNTGRVRDTPVGITESAYRPLDVRWQLEEQLEALISTATKIDDPFEKSFFLLANIAYLQVFVDVNKRTSRVVCNIPLLKNGLCPISFFNMSREGYEKAIIHYYETGDPRRLAREYLKGYIASVERFREHTQSLQLDPEMRHFVFINRPLIRAVVRRYVLENGRSTLQSCFEEEAQYSPNRDSNSSKLYDYISRSVDGLHEGNLIIYGITDQEFSDWKAKPADPSNPLAAPAYERPTG